jgi:hypothetical protein
MTTERALSDPAPRLVPDLPFPRYAHVPGQTPHPHSDPRGHSYGPPAAPAAPLDPAHWPESRVYLYGLDLFNHGYYWEAHEAWEGLWHACGRAGTVADLLKGLIKLAAAGVKHREGRPAGVRSHAGRAERLVRAVAAAVGGEQPHLLGLDLGGLARLAESIHRDGWPAEPPVLRPVFPAA